MKRNVVDGQFKIRFGLMRRWRSPRLGKDAAGAEEFLFHALDDPCGHVGAFAMDALRRIDSSAARQAVMAYLEAQRWDESITADRQF